MNILRTYTDLQPSTNWHHTTDFSNLVLMTGQDYAVINWQESRPAQELQHHAQLFTKTSDGSLVVFSDKVWGNSEVDSVLRLFTYLPYPSDTEHKP